MGASLALRSASLCWHLRRQAWQKRKAIKLAAWAESQDLVMLHGVGASLCQCFDPVTLTTQMEQGPDKHGPLRRMRSPRAGLLYMRHRQSTVSSLHSNSNKT
jgi:hypothetical protein